MAGGANLGGAYVTITPTMSGSVSKIISLLGGIGNSGSKIGSNFGSSFSSKATSTMSAFAVTAGNLISSGITASMSAIGASLNSAVSRYDTLNNFPKVMQNLGISSEDASKAIQKASEGLSGLPTTLDAGASAIQRFTSVNNNVEKSTDMFLALNNAILAGGQSTQIQESALEQLSQAYSKGKMDMMEWRTLQMAMPAQLNQIAQAMGMSTDELGEGLRGGTVSMDDFMNKIVELNDEGVGQFASFSEQAKSSVGGLGTSMTNLQTQITKATTSMIGGIDEMLSSNGFPTLAGMIQNVSKEITNFGTQVGTAIGQIKIKDFIDKLNQVNAQPIEELKNAFGELKAKFDELVGVARPFVEDLITTFSPIVMKVAEIATKIGTLVMKLVTDLINFVQPFLPVIQTVITVLVDGINNFISATSGLPPIVQSGILLAGAFTLLAGKMALLRVTQYAVQWLKLGKTFNVIKSAVGTVGSKLTGMIPSLKSINKVMKKSSAKKMLKYAAAIALLGAGVALIAVGFGIMAQACIALSTAGAPAMIMFGVMMASILALVVIMRQFGPALTLASAGMLAFGGMILMVCAGLSLLIATIAVFQPQLTALINSISQNVLAIINAVAQSIIAIITTVGNVIVNIANTAGAIVIGIINAITGGIIGIISTVAGAISTIVYSVATGIQIVVMSVATAIILIVQTIGTTISQIISTTGESINLVCQGIEGVVRGIGDSISNIFTSIFNGISEVINSIFNGLQTCGWAVETIATQGWNASAALAAFGATAVSVGVVIGDCAGKLGSMGSSVSECSGSLDSGVGSVVNMQSALLTLSNAISISLLAFSNFTSQINSAMSQASSIVQSKMNEIRNAINNAHLEAKVNISVGKLPHFRLEGEFNAEKGSVPKVKVDWYKRGGVFTSPSIIGVGEAGSEAVLPLNSSTYGEIAEGIADNSNGYSLISWLSNNLGSIINQNAPQTVIDNDAGALIVDNRLVQLQRKAGMNRG